MSLKARRNALNRERIEKAALKLKGKVVDDSNTVGLPGSVSQQSSAVSDEAEGSCSPGREMDRGGMDPGQGGKLKVGLLSRLADRLRGREVKET